LLLCIISSLVGCSSVEDSIAARKLEEQLLSVLDDWVSSGGKINDVQNAVVETCGKHVIVTVDGNEKGALSTADTDEFHFRVGVCTDITVNLVQPQPQINDPGTTRIICEESSVILFQKPCSRGG